MTIICCPLRREQDKQEGEEGEEEESEEELKEAEENVRGVALNNNNVRGVALNKPQRKKKVIERFEPPQQSERENQKMKKRYVNQAFSASLLCRYILHDHTFPSQYRVSGPMSGHGSKSDHDG